MIGPFFHKIERPVSYRKKTVDSLAVPPLTKKTKDEKEPISTSVTYWL